MTVATARDSSRGLEVRLDWAEMLIAGNAGVMRQVNALRKSLHDPDSHHRDPLEAHVSGAIAEWAVAKALGRVWNPTVGITWAGDVAGDVGHIEVRSTALPNGSLIAHDYSFDERIYLLVLTHRAPAYILRGWLYGHECKRREWWRPNAPRPAYFVPQSALHAIEELDRG